METVLHVATKARQERWAQRVRCPRGLKEASCHRCEFDGQDANHAIAKAGQRSCALCRPLLPSIGADEMAQKQRFANRLQWRGSPIVRENIPL
jgi:hypothetical protein